MKITQLIQILQNIWKEKDANLDILIIYHPGDKAVPLKVNNVTVREGKVVFSA
jgi:hypothetical protein